MPDFSDTELAIVGMAIIGIVSLFYLGEANAQGIIHDILLVLGGVVSGKSIRK